MIKIKKVLFWLFFTYNLSAVSQDRFNIENLGLSFSKPVDWYTVDAKKELENIKKYDFTDEEIKKITSGAESVNLAIFTKYDFEKTTDIIPTIKIKTEQNPAKNNKEFLEFINQSYKNFSEQLDNFKVTEEPTVTIISNQTAFYSVVTFTLNFRGKTIEIKTESYTIPRSKYCITINFIEENNKEDNSSIYNNLLKSIIIK